MTPEISAPLQGAGAGRGILVGAGILAMTGALLAACLDAIFPIKGFEAVLPVGGSELAAEAEHRLAFARTPEDFEVASSMARSALRRAPLDSRAVSTLALYEEHQGRLQQASDLMTIAEQRTLRDTSVETWLLQHALTDRSFASAYRHADILLRRRPEDSSFLFPMLFASLTSTQAAAAMAARLAHKPEWRSGFLQAAAEGDLDLATHLISALGATSGPPTDAEASGVIDAWMAKGAFLKAAALWRAFVRPSGGEHVYDGTFRGLAGPPPFNWRYTSDGPRLSEPSSAPDGHAALHVQSPASGAEGLVEEWTTAPPGAYQLSGQALAPGSAGAPRFAWRVDCRPSNLRILEVKELAAGSSWTPFQGAFTIPPSGCDAQILSLAALPQIGSEPFEGWQSNVDIEPSRERAVAGVAWSAQK